ncbi:MAG: molybdopterin-binding protein [Clostridium sp.]|uniref:molybdopterin-binding protein n=1 Tax=Clostridium sp. TaxID=1506 RepID=UPI003F360D6E
MKSVKVEESIGMVLCHDITKIIPGELKGRAFKKGHIIREEDIEELLSIGKEHIYVWEKEEGTLHENDAAIRLKDLVCGDGLKFGEIKEGKINFIAAKDGLLKIDKEELLKINMLGDIIVSTIHNNTPVKKGEIIGATRIIPLVIDEKKIIEAENSVKKSIINIEEIKEKKVFMITTGSEVYHGRIKDAFGPAVKKKLDYYGCKLIEQTIIKDCKDDIVKEIKRALRSGAEMIVCTGGMSVDPDDVTPTAIKECGANLISYGAPVLPGAMFLLSYYGDIPILGLPGCVMYSKRTIFDLVLPRILSDEKLTMRDLALYGHGGFCLSCNVCTFPHCSFGKGE